MTNPNLEKAIAQFNQRDFYSCHDTLEEIWMDSAEPEKTFYQGVLQVAVGCYHLGNSNWRGAVILLGEGIRKLMEYEPEYLEINVTQLTDDSHNLLRALQEIKPDCVGEFHHQLLTQQLDNNLALPVIKLAL